MATSINQCVQTMDLMEYIDTGIPTKERDNNCYKDQMRAHSIFFNAVFDHNKTEPLRVVPHKQQFKKHSQPGDMKMIQIEEVEKQFPNTFRKVQFSPFKGDFRHNLQFSKKETILELDTQKSHIVHSKPRNPRKILFKSNQNSIVSILKSEQQHQLNQQNIKHLPISTQFQNKIVKSLIEQKQQEIKQKWVKQQKQFIIISSSPKRKRKISMQDILPLTERRFTVKGNSIKSRDSSPNRFNK